VTLGDYALKRGPWKRKGGPCPECSSERCRSVTTFACWARAYRLAMREHEYMRSGEHTRTLRAAGFTILVAPQAARNEVVYAPTWAVVLLATLRQEARENNRGLSTVTVRERLLLDPRFGPPSPALLARIDELRAFAVLRGWSCSRGMWER